jgi:hypothetical protein
MDTEYADSEEELDPPGQQGKRRRVPSPSSTQHHRQSTVSASAAGSSVEGLPRRISTRGDDEEEDGERANLGFVQPRYKEDAQDDRVASFLHVECHAPTSAEGAMTLASAVALKFYSLLMRPSVMGTVAPGHEESLSPHHASASYEERMSDRVGGWARWSEEEDKLLLSLKRKNTPWGEIERRFPHRTLASLRQRCSTLNNRSRPSERNRGRRRKSK